MVSAWLTASMRDWVRPGRRFGRTRWPAALGGLAANVPHAAVRRPPPGARRPVARGVLAANVPHTAARRHHPSRPRVRVACASYTEATSTWSPQSATPKPTADAATATKAGPILFIDAVKPPHPSGRPPGVSGSRSCDGGRPRLPARRRRISTCCSWPRDGTTGHVSARARAATRRPRRRAPAPPRADRAARACSASRAPVSRLRARCGSRDRVPRARRPSGLRP